MKLNDYLIYDGKHMSTIEVEEMEKTGVPVPDFMDKDSVHKIYKFPNGYGASVVKGWFSHDLWETIVIDFVNEYDDFNILGDIKRYTHFKEIEYVLRLIKNSESGTLDNIEEFPF